MYAQKKEETSLYAELHLLADSEIQNYVRERLQTFYNAIMIC